MNVVMSSSRRARTLARDAWRTSRPASARTRGAFAAPGGGGRRGAHVLVAPPGAGNIGDQAMVEAFIENTDGRVVVVQRHEGDVVVPAGHGDVELLSLPDLVYGPAAARRADLRRYRDVLDDAASVSVVGADMMDGKYSALGSVRRALLAELAALHGVPARILGFSWNSSPRRSARAAVSAATRAGVLPLLRDPDSAERARRDGLTGVVETTDMVFAARTVDVSVAEEVRLLVGSEPFVVVNASALVARQTDQVAEYVRIVQRLRDDGFHTVLLPHVLRGSSDDLTAVRAVARATGDDRVHVVERQLTPAQVRGLAGAAGFVVTGRMHLAIMAMWSGVPPVTFSTQGKVAGLMRRFGVPQLSVDPRAGMADTVIGLFGSLGADGPAARSIAAALPAAKEAARENFPSAAGAGEVLHAQRRRQHELEL